MRAFVVWGYRNLRTQSSRNLGFGHIFGTNKVDLKIDMLTSLTKGSLYVALTIEILRLPVVNKKMIKTLYTYKLCFVLFIFTFVSVLCVSLRWV